MRHTRSFCWKDPCTYLLAGFNAADFDILGPEPVPYRVKIDYIAPTLEPVKTSKLNYFAMPTINPTKTYQAAIQEGIQYDILWVGAGGHIIILSILLVVISAMQALFPTW